MNNDELLMHARRELDSLPLSKIGAQPKDFPEAKIYEWPPVAIVQFSCRNRNDTYEMALNKTDGSWIVSTLLQHELIKMEVLPDDELLAKARNLLNSRLRHPLFKIGIEPEEFTEAKILDATCVIIRFDSPRGDSVEIILNSKTGNCVDVTHIQPKKKRH
jgi:hypothetical protein